MNPRTSLLQVAQSEAAQLTQYLQTLTPDAWRQPSACAEWNVGDVVGHLIWGFQLFTDSTRRALQGDTSPPQGFPPVGANAATAGTFYTQNAIDLHQRLGDALLPTFISSLEKLRQTFDALTDDDWDVRGYHPATLFPAWAFLNAQITELAMHGWDIRSRFEPERNTYFSDGSLSVFMATLPRLIGSWVFRPGPHSPVVPTVYRFVVSGAVDTTQTLIIDGDRCRVKTDDPTAAHLTVYCDTETYVLYMHGRLPLAAAVEQDRMRAEGSDEQAADYLAALGKWLQGV